MKTIAICNLKGGVAKTTTVVNLAADLARDSGKLVLVVDADSQCNATEFLGVSPGCGCTLADMLRLREAERINLGCVASQAITSTKIPGVFLLPADDTLMDLDLSKVEEGKAYVACLRGLRPALELRSYDFVLIDCPPAFNAAAAAALLAADEVLIPIKLDAFSLRGLANITRQIGNMRKINASLRVAGILPVMWYESEDNRKAMQQLQQSGLPLLPRIRRSTMVDAMTYKQEPLIVSSPKSGACKDYRALARRIAEGRY